MGHRRPETTAIYSRLSDDPVRNAMATAAAAIVKAGKDGGQAMNERLQKQLEQAAEVVADARRLLETLPKKVLDERVMNRCMAGLFHRAGYGSYSIE